MKAFKSYLTSLCLVIIFIMTSCEKIEPAVISNGVLSLPLWSDWKYKPQQGIDTIEGIFTDGCEEIGYSAGYFTSSDYTHSAEDLYYEEILIDGVPCKIVEVRGQGEFDILLFLFFKKGVNESEQGHLGINDPKDVGKYIDIFKSVHFL
ncbi:MAG: hypothetical protein WBP41_03545 [Saprospiraceae bacterium]